LIWKWAVPAVFIVLILIRSEVACPARSNKSIVSGPLQVNVPAGISYSHKTWHLDGERVLGRRDPPHFAVHATHRSLPGSFVHIEEASWGSGSGYKEIESAEHIFYKSVPRLDSEWKPGVESVAPQIVQLGEFPAYGCTWKEDERFERSFFIFVARPEAYIVAMRLPLGDIEKGKGSAYASLLSVATDLTRAKR